MYLLVCSSYHRHATLIFPVSLFRLRLLLLYSFLLHGPPLPIQHAKVDTIPKAPFVPHGFSLSSFFYKSQSAVQLTGTFIPLKSAYAHPMQTGTLECVLKGPTNCLGPVTLPLVCGKNINPYLGSAVVHGAWGAPVEMHLTYCAAGAELVQAAFFFFFFFLASNHAEVGDCKHTLSGLLRKTYYLCVYQQQLAWHSGQGVYC